MQIACHFQLLSNISFNKQFLFLMWLFNKHSLLFKDGGQLPAIFTRGNLGVQLLSGWGGRGGHVGGEGHLVPLLMRLHGAGATVWTIHGLQSVIKAKG